MKKLTQIFEHFVTASNDKQMEEIVDKYGDEIISIIEYGYKDIGGCSGISEKEDILKEADMCKLYRKDGKILAVSLYADKRHPNQGSPIYLNDRVKNRGRKVVACAAAEGCSEYLKKIMTEDFSRGERNVWGEFSSKAATFAMRCGAIPIPISTAEAIMQGKTFYDKKIDGFFYTRRIGDDKTGPLHTKILMGNHLFVNDVVREKPTEEEIQHFKALAKKYAEDDKKLVGL